MENALAFFAKLAAIALSLFLASVTATTTVMTDSTMTVTMESSTAMPPASTSGKTDSPTMSSTTDPTGMATHTTEMATDSTTVAGSGTDSANTSAVTPTDMSSTAESGSVTDSGDNGTSADGGTTTDGGAPTYNGTSTDDGTSQTVMPMTTMDSGMTDDNSTNGSMPDSSTEDTGAGTQPLNCYTCSGTYDECGPARKSNDPSETCEAGVHCYIQAKQNTNTSYTFSRSCHTGACTTAEETWTCDEAKKKCTQCCSTDKCNGKVMAKLDNGADNGKMAGALIWLPLVALVTCLARF